MRTGFSRMRNTFPHLQDTFARLRNACSDKTAMSPNKSYIASVYYTAKSYYISALLLLFIAMAAYSESALSYTNNTYQKLADEYTIKAQKAFDVGLYDNATDYAARAAENAALSKAYIDKMLKRDEAADALNKARERLDWAASVNAGKTSPIAYSVAQQNYANAAASFSSEDFSETATYSAVVLDALKDVKALQVLPKYYVVRPWKTSGDCLWNITKRTYVYNNPHLWENIYHANIDKMSDPKNPNLLLPGQVITIPSAAGELREGTWTEGVEYEVFNPNIN